MFFAGHDFDRRPQTLDEPRPPTAIELTGVSKRFGLVVANRPSISMRRYGEVHALVGENGAGKSTLMSILAGLYRPEAGRSDRRRAGHSQSPRDAIAHGIGMVYQHFMLVEPFTVAENLLLGMPRRASV